MLHSTGLLPTLGGDIKCLRVTLSYIPLTKLSLLQDFAECLECSCSYFYVSMSFCRKELMVTVSHVLKLQIFSSNDGINLANENAAVVEIFLYLYFA